MNIEQNKKRNIRPTIVTCIFGHKFILNKEGEKAVWLEGKKKKSNSTIYICKNHVFWFDLLSFIFHRARSFWNFIDNMTKPKNKKSDNENA